jgi:hypothetical protein
MKLVALYLLLVLPMVAAPLRPIPEAEKRLRDPFAPYHLFQAPTAHFWTTKTFRVSRVHDSEAPENRETLLRIYETWAKSYIPQPVDLRLRVSRVKTPEGLYIATDLLSRDARQVIVEYEPGLAEGDRFRVHAWRHGNYTFGSPNNPRVLPHFSRERPPVPSRELFTALLRESGSLEVSVIELRLCPTCGGRGHIRGNPEQGQNPDRRLPCPHDAPGHPGQTFTRVDYTVVW